ncbi:MAG: hypothetical protein V3V08_01275 [Nannocystaceae bacterium]
MQKRRSGHPTSTNPELFAPSRFPRDLVDGRIEHEIDVLRRSRLFDGFDSEAFSRAFASRLTTGELCGGTRALRSRGLAWCARVLSPSASRQDADRCLKLARKLGDCPEIDIAAACISSQRHGKSVALAELAVIGSPASRSASLKVISQHDGPKRAVEWMAEARLGVAELDPEGRLFVLAQQLEMGRTEDARETVSSLTDDDFADMPGLHHLVGVTHLLSAVPAERHNTVIRQVPFPVRQCPLASSAGALRSRRAAYKHFRTSAETARKLRLRDLATLDDDYALWLQLSDPDTAEKGRRLLVDNLRQPESALRLVPFGVDFGVDLDVQEVERTIEQETARNGGITRDAAAARLALSFLQPPDRAAAYLGRHFADLRRHMPEEFLRFLQVEMFCRAGMPERATEIMTLLQETGIANADASRLESIVAEAKGTDPIDARTKQFRLTGALVDLVALVRELESRNELDGLCEYGELLFARTGAADDADRFVRALTARQMTQRVIHFCEANFDLRTRSGTLHMSYCWALFNEGALLQARSELRKLSGDAGDANYKSKPLTDHPHPQAA